MGTHRNFIIDADVDADLETNIKEFIGPENLDLWRKPSGMSKWDGGWDVAKNLSKQFPKVIFSLKSSDEYGGSCKYFYLNGLAVEESFVIPRFPTKTQWHKGLKVQSFKLKADRIAEEERRLMRLEDEKRKKIASLELELKQLKETA